MGINERFTRFADWVSETVGQWWFSALSLCLLTAWVLYGVLVVSHSVADWFSSQQWNFPLNTVTTVGEWFMEGLIAAAANRVERRNREMQDAHTALLSDIRRWVEREQREIEALKDEVAAEVAALEDRDTAAPAAGEAEEQQQHGSAVDG